LKKIENAGNAKNANIAKNAKNAETVQQHFQRLLLGFNKNNCNVFFNIFFSIVILGLKNSALCYKKILIFPVPAFQNTYQHIESNIGNPSICNTPEI
jgi:hypothetical protein